MNKKIVTAGLLSAIVLTGCGVIEKRIASNDSLKDKAAQAIEVAPNGIEISEIRSSIDKVKFIATTADTKYSCYYTTVIALDSDAVCNKYGAASSTSTQKASSTSTQKASSTSTQKASSKSCNALLKAAGKCD